MLKSMSQFILPYKGIMPNIHESAFIAPTANIIGEVEIGEEASIWYNCVLRGDVYDIKIGARTNIQDGTVIHTTSDLQGTYVGDDVTVGHSCLLHACTVESGGFVGMQSLMLDESVVESGAMLAAGSMLTPGKCVPKGQLWAGRPAKYMRDLTEDDYKAMKWNSAHYVALSREYL